MPLTQATLSSGLAGMAPTTSEATAITNFANAWDSYFAQSSVNGIVATPGSYAVGLTALRGALVGMSATGQGATKIQAGLTAFWSAIAALPTTIWITAPMVLVPPIAPPPGLAGLVAALAAVFASNQAGSLSLADAADAVAGVLHPNGGLGAVVSGSVPPAPPAPVPIL